jgi:hypothetical protein
MAFCIFKGDSFKSFAIAGNEVFRIVESSICIKIAVAKITGSSFLTDSGDCTDISELIRESNVPIC